MTNSGAPRLATLAVIAIFAALLSAESRGAPGDLDGSFDGDGKVLTDFSGGSVSKATGVAVQSDGRIVVVGYTAGPFASNQDFAIVRFNTNGNLDGGFGSGGQVLTDFSGDSVSKATGVAIQSNGKIVVVGYTAGPFASNQDFAIARFNTNGSLDGGFGSGGQVLTDFSGGSVSLATGAAIQPDGKIVVVGYTAGPFASDQDFAIARFNTNGSLDGGFGSGGKVLTDFSGGSVSKATGVAIQSDGKIVVVGYTVAPFASDQDFAIARFNTNGSLDGGFGSGGKVLTDFSGGSVSKATGVAIQSDGKIVVVGYTAGPFASNQDFAIARFNTNGSLDGGFGSGGQVLTDFSGGSISRATGVAIQSDGKIVVVGYTAGPFASNQDFAIARFNTNGSLDGGFGSGGQVLTDFSGGSVSLATGAAMQPDGKIVVVGYTAGPFASDQDFAIARFESGLAPEIAVEQPAGTNLTSGTSTVSFATVDLGQNTTRTFTVRNTGNAVLSGVSASFSGANAADYAVTIAPATTVAASGATTFIVRFTPSTAGTRATTLRIASNDANENPFSIALTGTGLAPAPEIAVSGNGTNITDDDSTPSLTDHTDFGSASTAGVTVTRIYTIANTGTANLTLGTVTVGGTNPGDFNITVQPASPVTAGNSTTFQVVFDPSAASLRSATVSFTTNDSGENPFNFNIQGTGLAPAPEIVVSGNGVNITNNDITPALADHTDFGGVNVASGTVVRTYTITNTGTASLTLGPVTVGGMSSDFTVTAQPATPLAAGGSTTFQVSFDPIAASLRSATLSFTNNDSNENPFNFGLQGTGTVPGDVDLLDLNVDGGVWATAVQPDGKIILAGGFSSVLGVPRNNIARVNADGTLDTGFDPKANGNVESVAMQADGKVLLGGNFTTLQPNGAGSTTVRNHVARVNADGTLDTGFDPKANADVYCVAIQADGKILLGGNFTTLQPNGAGAATTRNRVARINADGTLDTGFDPKANFAVTSVAVQANGKVVLGGWFTTLQPNGAGAAIARSNIARVHADGTLDAGFDPKTNVDVYCVAVQADGKVLLGGAFTTLQPNGAGAATARSKIARVNADGTLDTGFDPKVNGPVFSIAVQADGKVLLGGFFSTLQPNGAGGSTARSHIARVNADGTLDPGFDPKASDIVRSVAVQADGKVLLCGGFTSLQPNGAASPSPRNFFARLWNDPATRTLSASDATQVLWQRGGASPEVSQVTFEQSLNGGGTWTLLGAGTRLGTTSNWQLTGLGLPAGVPISLRARGRTTNGYNNGSSGFIEQTVAYNSVPIAEITVSGNSTNIPDGDSTPSPTDNTDFGGANIAGSTVVRTYSIANTGTADLTLGTVTVGGVNAADFTVTTQPTSPVVASGSTTFQVTFDPSVTNLRSATLSFTTNDGDENPFNFSIQGTGITTDSTAPTVTISSPADGVTVTTSSVLIGGSSSDNVAVASVWVQVNGGVWQTAAGTTSWGASVNLVVGPNTITAQAFDSSNNGSIQLSRTVTYTPGNFMDGLPDSAGYLLLNDAGGIKLYAAVRGTRVYVATESPGSNGVGTYDTHVLVSNSLLASATTSKYWAKAGLMAVTTNKPLLGGESINDYAGWVNAGTSAVVRKSDVLSGVMEGNFDLIEAFGSLPSVLYFSAAAHATADGGAMLRQAPLGNGDQNLNPAEFLAVPIDALMDRNVDGVLDRLDVSTNFRALVGPAAPGTIQISWPVVPGSRYQPESSADLYSWQSFGSAITALSGDDIIGVIDTTAIGPKKFYRIRKLP